MVTLLNKKVAKPGYRFIHEGKAEECLDCPIRKVCVENLEKGRIYEVIKVRRKKHKCKLIEDEVVVVEVINAPIEIAISPKKAIEEIITSYSSIPCEKICPYQSLCKPEGLKEGDKIKIEKVLNRIECPEGQELIKVIVRPILS